MRMSMGRNLRQRILDAQGGGGGQRYDGAPGGPSRLTGGAGAFGDGGQRNVGVPLLFAAVSGIVVYFALAALGLDFGLSLGVAAFAAILVATGVKVANQWERAIVLRLGRFHREAGPGIFVVIPVVDTVAAWIDQRVQATGFMAERTLTRDTVPVDVDAVLFWLVHDARRAALEVADYRSAVAWAAQTALRDVIGRTALSDMLAGREKIDQELQRTIDERTEPWGITVQSVEVRDVVIPVELENAMSREAQAERERRARVILGTAEREIADNFRRAAEMYAGNPVALHLRAMNILYESLKEKGALVVVPSTAVETMGLGGISGIAALGGDPARVTRTRPDAQTGAEPQGSE